MVLGRYLIVGYLDPEGIVEPVKPLEGASLTQGARVS